MYLIRSFIEKQSTRIRTDQHHSFMTRVALLLALLLTPFTSNQRRSSSGTFNFTDQLSPPGSNSINRNNFLLSDYHLLYFNQISHLNTSY